MTRQDSESGSPMNIVRIFMDAWDARDYAALDRIVNENCVFRSSTGDEPGETVAGKQAVLQRMRDMIAEETENASDSGRFWSIEDQVFAEWSYDDILKDGRRVTIRGMDRICVQNGLIMEIDAYRKSF